MCGTVAKLPIQLDCACLCDQIVKATTKADDSWQQLDKPASVDQDVGGKLTLGRSVGRSGLQPESGCCR